MRRESVTGKVSRWSNSRCWRTPLTLLAAGGVFACATATAQDPTLAPPPGEASDYADGENDGPILPLASGPLHEAFAEPYETDIDEGAVVDQQPPDPIDEVPPESRPEGENISWIPGYWGWDPEAEEFVWISGLWREVPPDRRWVPGYWEQVDDGYQWVSGFWADANVQELNYLPLPPESLESGPNIAAPEGDHFWIPGCWEYQQTDYQWRPGYWAPARQDWVWVPDHYSWAPGGCVYIPGYWDYPLANRGVLFAPVSFRQPVYRQPGYSYVPATVINSAPLLLNLFVSRGYNHYFFGNYYGFAGNGFGGNGFGGRGYGRGFNGPGGRGFGGPGGGFGLTPWYAYANHQRAYDPLLNYYQWQYAQRNVDFGHRLQSWNQYFVANPNVRPARTFSAQRALVSRLGNNSPVAASTLALASPLAQLVGGGNTGGVQFTRVEQAQRQQFVQAAANQRQFQTARREFERESRAQNNQQKSADNNANPAATKPRGFKMPENTRANSGTPQQDNSPPGQNDRPNNSGRQTPPARPTAAQDTNGETPNDRPRQPPRTGRPGGADDRPNDQPNGNTAGNNRPNSNANDRPNTPKTPNGNDKPNGNNKPDGNNKPNGNGRPDPGDSGNRPERPNQETPNPDDQTGRQQPRFPRFGVGNGAQQNKPGNAGAANPAAGDNRPDAPGARSGEPNRRGDQTNRPGAGDDNGRPDNGRPNAGNDPFDRLPPGVQDRQPPGRQGFGDRTPPGNGSRPNANPNQPREGMTPGGRNPGQNRPAGPAERPDGPGAGGPGNAPGRPGGNPAARPGGNPPGGNPPGGNPPANPGNNVGPGNNAGPGNAGGRPGGNPGAGGAGPRPNAPAAGGRQPGANPAAGKPAGGPKAPGGAGPKAEASQRSSRGASRPSGRYAARLEPRRAFGAYLAPALNSPNRLLLFFFGAAASLLRSSSESSIFRAKPSIARVSFALGDCVISGTPLLRLCTIVG